MGDTVHKYRYTGHSSFNRPIIVSKNDGGLPVSPPLDFLNWIFLFVALSAMALLLRALSRRLGEALHTKKYYFLYDASVILLVVSGLIVLFNYPDGTWALPGRLLFLAGALLIVGTTVRYWGWILPEMLKPDK